MASSGNRAEVDGRISVWEQDLERLRLALAQGPPEVHERFGQRFVDLYRAKETVKSRWEAVRGVYRPEPGDLMRFEEALRAMEAAWTAERPLVSEVLGLRAG
jgi:hypothetical protein